MDDRKERKSTGKFGVGNPGRPKGAKNKLTAEAKDVIAEVAQLLGGAPRLLAWVKEDAKNEAAYWQTIYPKLLPLTIGGDSSAAPIVLTWQK